MLIGGVAGKARLDKYDYYNYYDNGEFGDEAYPGFRFARQGRQLESDTQMKHSMTKTLKQIDTEKCLQKLVCYLEEQNDRSLEEEMLLKIFPASDCGRSMYPRCAAKEVELRELLRYYERVESKAVESVKIGQL